MVCWLCRSLRYGCWPGSLPSRNEVFSMQLVWSRASMLDSAPKYCFWILQVDFYQKPVLLRGRPSILSSAIPQSVPIISPFTLLPKYLRSYHEPHITANSLTVSDPRQPLIRPELHYYTMFCPIGSRVCQLIFHHLLECVSTLFYFSFMDCPCWCWCHMTQSPYRLLPQR